MSIQESNNITVSDNEIKVEHFEESSSASEPSAQIISNRHNGKEIVDEHFDDLKCIVPEEIYVKSEVQEEDQFNINKVSEREIKDEYFDVPESIAHEDIAIKTEDQEEDQSNSKYFDPENEESRKIYTCRHCYTGLSAEKYKNVHERRCKFRKKEQHLGGVYECSYCKLLYTTEGDRNKHQGVCKKRKELENYEKGTTKKGERTYCCDKCDFETQKKYNFTVHRRIHVKPNALKYSCDQCPYQTIDKSVLRKHLRTHNCFGLICILCQKSFKEKTTLDAHYVSRHPDRSDKWGTIITNKINECPKCNYKTVRTNRFKRHLATHETPPDQAHFKCKVCGYKCTSTNNFGAHFRLHVGQLPFVCTECDKRFSRKVYLDGHIISQHSQNEKLISSVTSKVHHCEKCHYKTVYNNHFKDHLKKTCT